MIAIDMPQTRRFALASLLASGALALAQEEQQPNAPLPKQHDEDNPRLPNGRSQNDAIAKQQHEEAVKDAARLVGLAGEIRDEIDKAGNYVVPVSTLRKTEEIEKLARKIRSRLKS